MPHSAANDAMRLLTVTPGNVRQNHLYVRGLYDFFPRDCIGPSRKSKTENSPRDQVFVGGRVIADAILLLRVSATA